MQTRLDRWTFITPTFMVATLVVIYLIFRVQNWGIGALLLLLTALYGVWQDQNQDIPWRRFLPIGFWGLLFPYVMFKYATPFWYSVASAQTQHIRHYNWNEWFNSIPFNDAAFLWSWEPEWMIIAFGWVYHYGFALSFWTCIIRSFFTKRLSKMIHYALAGYVLQVPLIWYFYHTIFLQEVWYVKGMRDLLSPYYRNLTPEEAIIYVQNCFPSMHTSIAFAMLLMAMREKSRSFRWTMGTYCTLIILSTMFLRIHWVIDVIAGMIFAYAVVKLADLVMFLGRRIPVWVRHRKTIGAITETQ
jgi:membrane-associated phospholipid phosphatase